MKIIFRFFDKQKTSSNMHKKTFPIFDKVTKVLSPP